MKACLLQNAMEETSGIDQHGTPLGQEEQEDLPLDHCLDNLEPAKGASMLLNGLHIAFEYFLGFP